MSIDTDNFAVQETVPVHEGLEHPFETGIHDAVHGLEAVRTEIQELVQPLEHHGGEAGLLDLAGECLAHAEGAIGQVFRSAFGTANPSLEGQDPRTAEGARRLNVEPVYLRDLQEVRHDLADLGRRVQGVAGGVEQGVESAVDGAFSAVRDDLLAASQLLASLSHVILGPRPEIPPHGELPESPGGDAPPGLTPEISLVPETVMVTQSALNPTTNQWEFVVVPETEMIPEAILVPEVNPEPRFQPELRPESAPGREGEEPGVIGSPDADAGLIFQQGQNDLGDTGTCGVASQAIILEHFYGSGTFNENGLLHEAEDHGWFDTGNGTPRNDLGDLCELHGLHVEKGASSMDDLVNHLSRGEVAQVSLNAGVLWDDPGSYDTGQGNHAVVVTGVREDASGHVTSVFVDDTGDGQAKEISVDKFQQAWDGSNDYAAYVSKP